jgi:SAM-dependent methyltransferase
LSIVREISAPALPQRADLAAWSDHWSEDNQQSAAQKFFSFYRKAIFARTVQYFVDKYFPEDGVFVEAGSGTSETSMRIDKAGGSRKLTAVDIVHPILMRCHPAMDFRVCSDIFSLPFRDGSVDGIWNVGVMEHFTHEQIDAIMRECHRVLKRDAPLILLWPGVSSVPQRMLRVAEWVLNKRQSGEKIQFHPDEISQLRSAREGRHVLARNGFEVLEVEPGWRSLLAFKVLVGAKS